MSFKSLLFTLALSSSIFLTTTFAQKSTFEADIRGVDGRPSKAAQVRIERQDKKMTPMVVAGDKRGHLAAVNLEAGTYKVTATVEGGVQSSQTVKVLSNKRSLATFDMSKAAAMTGKQKKRYVWVPAETGTSVGGRWVEVGDDLPGNGPSGRNIDRLNGNSMDNIQRSQGFRPKAGGGE